MRNKINQKVKSNLKSWNIYNYEIDYGYDCITVELLQTEEISPQTIKDLKDDLKTDISWITIINGNIALGFDISDFILQEFETWEAYEKKYGE